MFGGPRGQVRGPTSLQCETECLAGVCSQAWDAEMCKRFPLWSIAPVLNNAALGAAASVTAQKAMGGRDEQLEALLGDDAWHDVFLCATGPGGLHPRSSIGSSCLVAFVRWAGACCA